MKPAWTSGTTPICAPRPLDRAVGDICPGRRKRFQGSQSCSRKQLKHARAKSTPWFQTKNNIPEALFLENEKRFPERLRLKWAERRRCQVLLAHLPETLCCCTNLAYIPPMTPICNDCRRDKRSWRLRRSEVTLACPFVPMPMSPCFPRCSKPFPWNDIRRWEIIRKGGEGLARTLATHPRA